METAQAIFAGVERGRTRNHVTGSDASRGQSRDWKLRNIRPRGAPEVTLVT